MTATMAEAAATSKRYRRRGSGKKKSEVAQAVERHWRSILDGVMLCIDPSCGSDSSQPAWAIFHHGLYIRSGVFALPPGQELPIRLYRLGEQIRAMLSMWSVDVAVVEDIPPMRFGAPGQWSGYTNQKAQRSLHESVGAVKSSIECHRWLRVQPSTWHRFTPEGYVKSDEADARMLGVAVIELAKLERDRVAKAAAKAEEAAAKGKSVKRKKRSPGTRRTRKVAAE